MFDSLRYVDWVFQLNSCVLSYCRWKIEIVPTIPNVLLLKLRIVVCERFCKCLCVVVSLCCRLRSALLIHNHTSHCSVDKRLNVIWKRIATIIRRRNKKPLMIQTIYFHFFFNFLERIIIVEFLQYFEQPEYIWWGNEFAWVKPEEWILHKPFSTSALENQLNLNG